MRMTFDRRLFLSAYVELVILSTLIFGALLLIVMLVLSPLGLIDNLLFPGGVVSAVLLGLAYYFFLKKHDTYARIIGLIILLIALYASVQNVFQAVHIPSLIALYPLPALFFLTNGLCLVFGSTSLVGIWLLRGSAIIWLLISLSLLALQWTYPIGYLLGNNASATSLSLAFMLMTSPCLYLIPELRRKGIHSLSRNALCYALTTVTITCLTWYVLNLQYYQSVRQTSQNLVINLQHGIEQIVKEHHLIVSWLGRGWEGIPLDSTKDENNSLRNAARMILGDMPSLKAIALLPHENIYPTILAERDAESTNWSNWINSAIISNKAMNNNNIRMLIDSSNKEAWLLIQVTLTGTDDRIIAVSKFRELLGHHLNLDTRPFSIHVFHDNQEIYHLGGNDHDHEHSDLTSTSTATISNGPLLKYESIHSDKIAEAFLPNLLILLVIFGMVLSVIIATSIELSRINYSRAERIKKASVRQLKIHKIQEMIVNHDLLTNTLNAISELLDNTIPNARSSIWLLNEKSSSLQYIASSHLDHKLKKALSRCEVPIESLTKLNSKASNKGQIAINSSLINCHDLDDSIIKQSGYTFCHATPVVTAKGRTLGVIEFYQPNSLSHTERCEIDETALEHIDEIIPLISMAIERHQDQENLMYSSQHDALTGLPNRTVLESRLNSWFGSQHQPSNACLLFIDLDGFKPINDGLGHATGDLVLIEVAKRLTQIFRAGDLVVRFGGDEFVILILDNEDLTSSSKLFERVLDSISDPYLISNLEISVTASIGIAKAESPTDIDSPMSLIQQADIAMYDAKRRGKNSAQWYNEPSRRNTLSQVTLRNELQKALGNDEFELHYQPILLSNGNIRGFEALIRWYHPEHGRIPPDEFIPLAEDTGQIIPLSEWVIDRACRDAARLCLHDNISLGINIAPLHFHRTDFITGVLRTLEKYSLKPNALVLELTERTLMDEHGTMLQTLKTLRNSGLQISIDDFGTGYSSLSLIKHLPVTSIKIDKSFVTDIDHSELDAGMARAIIDMAHHLGLGVVAEGVETQEQLSKLRAWGCDSFQGYYLCRPADVDSMLTFATTWQGFSDDIQ